MRLTARSFDTLRMTIGWDTHTRFGILYDFIFPKSEFGYCKNLQKQYIKLQFQQNTEK